jgi:hypothetical protein
MSVYVKDVIWEIQRLLKDDTYTANILLNLINQGMKNISNATLPNGLEVYLPELETDGTVTTSTSLWYGTMPTDYQKKIVSCYSDTQSEYVKVEPSYAMLTAQYFDGLIDTGNVRRVARRGSRLYYNPQPSSADTLTLHYWKNPTELALEDEITELPDGFIVPLLKAYCLREMFTEIEIQSRQPIEKSILWDKVYIAKLHEMMEMLGPYAFEPAEIRDRYGML